MTYATHTAATLATALFLALPASLAYADLSAADIARIDGKSGIRVLSSDGAFVGTTFGLNINGSRVRMFLLPRPGSIFRIRGKDIAITTETTLMTLRDGAVVLDADERRLRVRAQTTESRDEGPITITLLR